MTDWADRPWQPSHIQAFAATITEGDPRWILPPWVWEWSP